MNFDAFGLGLDQDMKSGDSKMRIEKQFSSLVAAAIGASLCTSVVWSQSGSSIYEGDWPEYHGNELAQRYSPLDQINADNVGSVELAWQFSTANFGPTTDFNNPSTPIEIDGVLYANIGSTRNVVA